MEEKKILKELETIRAHHVSAMSHMQAADEKYYRLLESLAAGVSTPSKSNGESARILKMKTEILANREKTRLKQQERHKKTSTANTGSK